MRGLALNAGDVLGDGTCGAGGYTRAALAAGAGHVWAFDSDPNAIAEGRALDDGSDGRLTLILARISNLVSVLGASGVVEVDAVTFDIWLSSVALAKCGTEWCRETVGRSVWISVVAVH